MKNLLLTCGLAFLSFSFIPAALAETVVAKPGEKYVFTGPQGQQVEAVIIDKTDEAVKILATANSKEYTLPLSRLNPKDVPYVNAWDKSAYEFMERCRTLTITELLESRGYEAVPFRLVNNSVILDGTINGKPATFQVDTGAYNTLIHNVSAEGFQCDIGPYDEVIRGVGGTQEAANTMVDTFSIGETVIKGESMLATDMTYGVDDFSESSDVLFGAMFLARLETVVSYAERKVFFRPDLADPDNAPTEELSGSFRRFQMADGGSTFIGKVKSKTERDVTLESKDGKVATVPISTLAEKDRSFVYGWTEDLAFFLEKAQDVSVEDILTLRRYLPLAYTQPEGHRHIYIDAVVNEMDTNFVIDTGASSTSFESKFSEKAGAEIGPYDQFVIGVGGKRPAAVTRYDALTIGGVTVRNRRVLSSDKGISSSNELGEAGLLGTDLFLEWGAVISYKEKKLFIREPKALPDLAGR